MQAFVPQLSCSFGKLWQVVSIGVCSGQAWVSNQGLFRGGVMVVLLIDEPSRTGARLATTFVGSAFSTTVIESVGMSGVSESCTVHVPSWGDERFHD